MTRNLKALVLSVVTTLAMSVVVAGASAATFHAEVTPAIFTSGGGEPPHGAHTFKSGESTVSCTTTTFTGTGVGENGTTTTTTISIRPTFAGCTFLGESATIDTTGCTFKIEAHTNAGGHLPTHLDCTGANAIKVTTGACTLSYGNQLTTGGSQATNLGSGAQRDVTIHITLVATFTKAGPLCFLVAGNTGTYTGTSTLRGYQEGSISKSLHEDGYMVTEGKQVGIFWE